MERDHVPPPEPRGRPVSIVDAWRRYDNDEQRLSAHVSERMLDLAGLRPGARVLDIATGRGEPALRAAARVAPDGFVVGTDVSDDMLDFARARVAAEAVTNLAIVVTGGETLAGAGFSFDREEELDTPLMEAATPDGLVEWCLAFGLPRELAEQPASVRKAWRRDMLAEAGRYRGADGLYRLGGVTRLVVARVA